MRGGADMPGGYLALVAESSPPTARFLRRSNPACRAAPVRYFVIGPDLNRLQQAGASHICAPKLLRNLMFRRFRLERALSRLSDPLWYWGHSAISSAGSGRRLSIRT